MSTAGSGAPASVGRAKGRHACAGAPCVTPSGRAVVECGWERSCLAQMRTAAGAKHHVDAGVQVRVQSCMQDMHCNSMQCVVAAQPLPPGLWVEVLICEWAPQLLTQHVLGVSASVEGSAEIDRAWWCAPQLRGARQSCASGCAPGLQRGAAFGRMQRSEWPEGC